MTLVRLPSTARRVQAACVIGLIATIFALPSSASAQHRARLSRDLTRQIQQNPDATVNVIAEGPQSEIDRIARQYGLQVVSRLDSGARLSGTAAQIDQAAGDGALTALAEDARVTGTMAVTTQSTGASQLWGGGKSGLRRHHRQGRQRRHHRLGHRAPHGFGQASRHVDRLRRSAGHGARRHLRPRHARGGDHRRQRRAAAAARTAAPTSAWRRRTGLISIRVLADGRIGPRVGRHQGASSGRSRTRTSSTSASINLSLGHPGVRRSTRTIRWRRPSSARSPPASSWSARPAIWARRRRHADRRRDRLARRTRRAR